MIILNRYFEGITRESIGVSEVWYQALHVTQRRAENIYPDRHIQIHSQERQNDHIRMRKIHVKVCNPRFKSLT